MWKANNIKSTISCGNNALRMFCKYPPWTVGWYSQNFLRVSYDQNYS